MQPAGPGVAAVVVAVVLAVGVAVLAASDILVADEETLAAESSGYDRPERVQASWPIDRVDQIVLEAASEKARLEVYRKRC